MRNEEVLHRVKEERNTVQTVKGRKCNWIGHSLCRKCLLKHVTEGKIEGSIELTGRRGRSYRMTLRKREDTGTWKKRHIAGVKKSILKRLWTCSKTGGVMMMMMMM